MLKHASQGDGVREAKTHQTSIQLCAGEEKGRMEEGREEWVGGRERGWEVETKSEVEGGGGEVNYYFAKCSTNTTSCPVLQLTGV